MCVFVRWQCREMRAFVLVPPSVVSLSADLALTREKGSVTVVD